MTELPSTTPSFEDWVDYCFTNGYRDFNEGLVDSTYSLVDPPLLAEYLGKLFADPAPICEHYLDEFIAGGIWFIFGAASEYMHRASRPVVPLDRQRHWLSSVSTMYRKLFFWRCDDHGESRDVDLTNKLKIDGAIYMIWDMDQLQYIIRRPELLDTGFGVLSEILELPSYTCRKSALHGLAHQATQHRKRVNTIIDAFLHRTPDLPLSLHEYAQLARDDRVL